MLRPAVSASPFAERGGAAGCFNSPTPIMTHKMMLTLSLVFASLIGTTACGHNDPTPTPTPQPQPQPDTTTHASGRLIVTVGGRRFTATPADNATTRAFLALLPLRANMQEHAGNEKYHNLSQSLPTDTYRPGTIQTGDLMLWNDNTVVLFYKTFTSSYSYTRLGRIDDPTGLAEAVGSGSVVVTFEQEK